ncbi:LAQU0S10e01926g1_1 [Lachancea quebecensis]|uniref:LAQU0S10e01926g1_1 n=1 Tax=Lachancea quebecensis TaxID=1654605 RepID=A0A0P1L286_9SACH|nr:LAQU0S10e01926g1_1 [Lachancea quebecensis]
MDVSSIPHYHAGTEDDASMFEELWKLLKNNPASIHALLNHEVMSRPVQALVDCLVQEHLEKRLVCLCILDFKLHSGCALLSHSEVLKATFSTISMAKADPKAIGACLRLLNTILASVGNTQPVELRSSDLDCITAEILTNENAAVLMDYIYLTLTHPWTQENEARQWLTELHRSGILWWLRHRLSSVLKLDFLEALFEDTMKLAYHTFVQAMQTFLRNQGVAKHLQFCGASQFSKLFDARDLKEHAADALVTLKIKPKVGSAATPYQLLDYFAKNPVESQTFWRALALDGPFLEPMWISPSRNMFMHASKTFMHEFAKLQCSVKDFVLRVHSRYSASQGKLTGESKYATSAFEIGRDPVTNSSYIKVDRMFAPGAQSGKWEELSEKILCLSRLDGTLYVVRVTVVRKDNSMLQLSISSGDVLSLQSCQILSTLNQELDLQTKALDAFLKSNLESEKLYTMTPMENIVQNKRPARSALISHLFSNEQQVKNFLDENLQDIERDPSKRRLVSIKEGISLDFEEKKWTRENALECVPRHEFTSEQINSVISGVRECVSCVNGDVGTGKATAVALILDNLYLNSFYERFPQSGCRFFVLCDTDETCHKIAGYLSCIREQSVVHYSDEVNSLIERKKKGVKDILSKIQEIAGLLNIPGDHSSSVPAALSFLQHFLEPIIHDYRSKIHTNEDVCNNVFALLKNKTSASTKSEITKRIIEASRQVSVMYDLLQKWQFLFLDGDLTKTLIESCDLFLIGKDNFQRLIIEGKSNFNSFENLIICNAEFLEPSEIWRALSLNTSWHKILFSGDFVNSPLPYIAQQLFPSMLQVRLTASFNTSHEVLKIRFPFEQEPDPIPALHPPVQFIKTPGEAVNNVNWDEAEYCVLLYAYLRLTGYPAQSISILALNPYQKYAVDTELDDWLESKPSHKSIRRPNCVNSLERNRSHRNEIVIVSTAGIQPNAAFLSRYARKGMLVLGINGGDLQVAANERFPSVKSGERKVSQVQDIEQLKSLVSNLLVSKRPQRRP